MSRWSLLLVSKGLLGDMESQLKLKRHQSVLWLLLAKKGGGEFVSFYAQKRMYEIKSKGKSCYGKLKKKLLCCKIFICFQIPYFVFWFEVHFQKVSFYLKIYEILNKLLQLIEIKGWQRLLNIEFPIILMKSIQLINCRGDESWHYWQVVPSCLAMTSIDILFLH